MKKSIIALMGLFTLVACSEDVYQEADKMSENGAVENTEPQNSIKTTDPTIGYNSPYNFGAPDPIHKILNATNFELRMTAYIGLAYDDSNTSPMYFGMFNLASGVYPNLFAGSIKYGNVVSSDVYTLMPNDVRYCYYGSAPMTPNPISPQPTDFNFTFSGITAQEIDLLRQYGKIYYIDYEIYDPTIASVIASGSLSSGFVPNIGSFGTLPGNWQPIGNDVIHSRELLSEMGSREIVVTENVGAGDFPSQVSIGANTLSMFTDPGVVYVWLQ